MLRTNAFIAAGLAALVLSAQAQVPANTSTITTRSTLVLVPTLAREKSGSLLYGLTANDFVLTDDGVPQKLILEEDAATIPLALVVLIEAGAGQRSAGWHPDSRDPSPNRFRSLPILIESIVGHVPHRIAVAGFDSKVELLQGFTSNTAAFSEAIDDYTDDDASDHGAAILDALGFAVEMLRKQPPQYRRAILLLSETNDRGSQLPLADAVRAISDTNTAIYSVAFSTSFAEASRYARKNLPTKRSVAPRNDLNPRTPAVTAPGSTDRVIAEMMSAMSGGITLGNPDPYPPGGCMGKDPNATEKQNKVAQAYDCLGQLAPPLALARMAAIAAVDGMHKNIPETVANMTGGEYFKFNGEASLERDLTAVSNHISNRYILSFQPASPHPGLHALTLRLKEQEGIALTARSSYWADAPSSK